MILFEKKGPGDLLTGAFLLGLIVLVLLRRRRLARWGRLLAIYLFLLLLQAAVPIAAALEIIPPLVAAFFPVVPILAIYSTLGFIPELGRGDRDASLIRLDRMLFRVDPSRWTERFASPWMIELMQLAYLAYYVLPFVLLGTLYQRGDEEAFQLSITALLLSHYLAFTGYMLVPALGPRFALKQECRKELNGLFITVPVRKLLDALEGVKRDAFPSGHASAILITVFYAVQFTSELTIWFLPIAALMVISTVYLRYHYVLDVLAGVLLAALCLLVAPVLQ